MVLWSAGTLTSTAQIMHRMKALGDLSEMLKIELECHHLLQACLQMWLCPLNHTSLYRLPACCVSCVVLIRKSIIIVPMTATVLSSYQTWQVQIFDTSLIERSSYSNYEPCSVLTETNPTQTKCISTWEATQDLDSNLLHIHYVSLRVKFHHLACTWAIENILNNTTNVIGNFSQ